MSEVLTVRGRLSSVWIWKTMFPATRRGGYLQRRASEYVVEWRKISLKQSRATKAFLDMAML